MQPIHVFRSGKQTDSSGVSHEFTSDTLQAIADRYHPELSESPLVIGHPATDDPAYGWISGLEYRSSPPEEEGLWASTQQLADGFEDIVEAGRYKHRSVSLYLPDHPNNPTPGDWYLRHVGFLGAQAPAVKGLRPIGFADAEAQVAEFSMTSSRVTSTIAELWSGLREWLIETSGIEAANRVTPKFMLDELNSIAETQRRDPEGAEAPMPNEGIVMSEEKKTDNTEDQANDALEQRIAQLEAAEASQKAENEQLKAQIEVHAAELLEAKRVAFGERVAGLVQGAKIAAKDAPALVELLMSAPDDKAVSFGEGDAAKEQPYADALFALINNRPAVNLKQELSASEQGDPTGETNEQIAQRIVAFRDKKAAEGITLSFTQAREQLMAQNH